MFSLRDQYREGKAIRRNKDGKVDTLTVSVTDLPTQTVTVRYGGRTKSVVDYFRIFGERESRIKTV